MLKPGYAAVILLCLSIVIVSWLFSSWLANRRREKQRTLFRRQYQYIEEQKKKRGWENRG